jgi:hypothetical protein
MEEEGASKLTKALQALVSLKHKTSTATQRELYEEAMMKLIP